MRRIASTVRLRCFCRRSFETRPGFARLTVVVPAAVRRRRPRRRARRRSAGRDRDRAGRRAARARRDRRGTRPPRGAPHRPPGPARRRGPPTRSQFWVPSSFDISVSAVRRGSTAAQLARVRRRRPRSPPARSTSCSRSVQYRAKAVAVAGSESVDLVEVVRQGAQAPPHRPGSPGRAAPRAIRPPPAPGPTSSSGARFASPTISSSSSPLLRK